MNSTYNDLINSATIGGDTIIEIEFDDGDIVEVDWHVGNLILEVAGEDEYTDMINKGSKKFRKWVKGLQDEYDL